MATLIYTDQRLHYGTLTSVSWDAVYALRGLQSDFLLLLLSGDDASSVMEARLQQFLRSASVGLFVVKVVLFSGSEAARQLSVSLVPQLRLYRRGLEVRRIRGVIGYDRLRSFWDKG